jgi:mannosidase alpha-like ER degradation enhancer 2
MLAFVLVLVLALPARRPLRHHRVSAGFCELRNVATREKADAMQSFFFAETMKYLYLLLGPPEKLSLNAVVFNTEAHPLRITW